MAVWHIFSCISSALIMPSQGLALILSRRCETAVGVIVFPNLTQAVKEMTFAISALQYVQSHETSSLAPAQCRDLGLETLGQAGIDEATIRNLICPMPSNSPSFATAHPSGPSSFPVPFNGSNSSLTYHPPLPTASSGLFMYLK